MAASILITRPDPEGTRFAESLRAKLGDKCTVCTSPLMQIEACANLPDLSNIGTLIFTSRNGVQTFGQLSDRRDIPAFAVGQATGDVAREIGLLVTVAGGDANQLTNLILTKRPETPCLHLRGEHVTGPLAQSLWNAGIETYEAVIYLQKPVPLSQQAQDCLGREAPVILPLFSPRSTRLFFSQADQGKWRAPLHVIAISEAVAEHVPGSWVSSLEIAATPDAQSMGQSIERLCLVSNRLEGG